MQHFTERGGVVYQATSVHIPADLRKKARDLQIPISRTLVEALKNKIAEREGEAPTKPLHAVPAAKSFKEHKT
jgi:post-segregation antitoxin (ccd killing protein)